jgi:uncharacterized RDD family membrane protein YckC
VNRDPLASVTVTPEAVRLQADTAGLGSRLIAIMLDSLIQTLLLLPVLIGVLSSGPSDSTVAVVVAILVFAILWLYYPLFEVLWGGRTPGKKAQGIRVIRTNGQPAGFAPVLVRNLVRIVDVYALPFLAVLSMIVTRRHQRLGDLAAGTMVVRDRSMPTPQVLGLPDDPGAPTVDTSVLTEREYELIRSFLARRDGLDPAARAQLAANITAVVRDKLGTSPAGAAPSDEQLLVAVARSYRGRFPERE